MANGWLESYGDFTFTKTTYDKDNLPTYPQDSTITLGNVYRNSPNYLSSTAEEVCQLTLAMKTLSWRHHRVALGDSDRAAWRFR